jgi:hypothetical protein
MDGPIEQQGGLGREEEVDNKEEVSVERTEGRRGTTRSNGSHTTVSFSSLPSTLPPANRSMVCVKLTAANLAMVLDAVLASAARGDTKEVEDDAQTKNTTLQRQVSGGRSTRQRRAWSLSIQSLTLTCKIPWLEHPRPGKMPDSNVPLEPDLKVL